MPATEPGDLTNTSWNGDVEETAVTSDPDNQGFPARKSDGELVFIVKQERVGLVKHLIDKDGNRYTDDGVAGLLVPVVSDEGAEPEPQADPVIGEMLQGVVDATPAIAQTPEQVVEAAEGIETQQVEEPQLPDAA
jgi:hypothetical protein